MDCPLASAFSMRWASVRSRFVTRDVIRPDAPARAVRPVRCKKSRGLRGKSKLMTWSTLPGMSKPLQQHHATQSMDKCAGDVQHPHEMMRAGHCHWHCMLLGVRQAGRINVQQIDQGCCAAVQKRNAQRCCC